MVWRGVFNCISMQATIGLMNPATGISSQSSCGCKAMIIFLLLILIPAAHGEGTIFEAASIRPSSPQLVGSMNGGPGTKDPVRWTCQYVMLLRLVRNAFNLRAFEVEGPSWLRNEHFDLAAKIPEGATVEQFQQMKQNLLIARFGLKFHREKKEIQGYELIVAKNGPKFKESGPEPPKDPDANPATASPLPTKLFDKDGFPVFPPGRTNHIITFTRREGETGAAGRWFNTPMEKIVAFISDQLDKPVSDNTNLTGKYDLSLAWISEPTDSTAPSIPDSYGNSIPFASSRPNSIFTALQEQLGLKLQPYRVTIEILVIDHIEKTPSEN